MHARARALTVALAALTTLAVPITAAGAAEARPGAFGFDGDPATTERVLEGDPTYAAVDISRLRFADAGDAGRHAEHVVLSRDDGFADSVGGSALTGDGPLLFTATDRLSTPTAAEIDRVLGGRGRVYLLGGTAAIGTAVERALRDDGHDVVRLAGRTRIGTALRVADTVRRLHPGDEVLVARAYGTDASPTAAWADSVAAGAVAAAGSVPVVVTTSDRLHPAVGAWLAADAPARTTLLGGTAALSSDVEASVPSPRRVAGADRTATAAAVARTLWPATGDRSFVVTNGTLPSGWSFGFAAAGLAADAAAPVLLVTDEVTRPTVELVSTCGAPAVDLEIVGDGSVVPAALREQLDAADGLACGPGGAIVYPTDLASFPACRDVLDHFREAALERVGPYGLDGLGVIALESDARSEAPAADVGGGEASTTNVQEAGVDEPDMVKTDGTHAYVVARGDLRIVRLGSAPATVATFDLPDTGSHELLLDGDRLLVLTRSHGYVTLDDASRSSIAGPGSASVTTTLTYLNMSDRRSPRVEKVVEVEGDYRSARMVGAVARVVVQTDPALSFTHPADGSREAHHAAAEHNRGVVTSSTLDDWLPSATVDGADRPLLDCSDVRRPPLFSGLGTLSVVTVDLAGSGEPTSSAAVVASGETVYASTSRLYVATGRWGWEPNALGSTVTTEVHAFAVDDPASTRYVGSGAVPGYVIGQFALSEHLGHLRIATTLEPPWRDGELQGETESGVHVLAERDSDLVTVGSVTGLGRGERIQAVRYFGDMAAVVTFRQVDPLYLLDLRDPRAPRVTGELKVPGFSSYLHRVADGRLLGVGVDATDEGMITGAQVSLFDIADTAAPRLLDRATFPNASSDVQWDHHAFLHWPQTGLVVVPLTEHRDDGSGFLGAVGLDVDGGTVTEVGRATHVDDAGRDAWPQIRRSLVAGGLLYTVSDAGLEVNDLSTLRELAWLGF